MFEECIHILADGRKCRRIPKRGQKLCPVHSAPRQRRAPLEENDAFQQEMNSFVDRLNALPLPLLLNEAIGLLAKIRLLIDRHASRRDRLEFARAAAAVGIAGDRMEDASHGPLPNPSPQSMPVRPPSVPDLSHHLSPETLSRLGRAEAILNSGRLIPPQELEELIRELDSCPA